jgi:hypothetical protein
VILPGQKTAIQSPAAFKRTDAPPHLQLALKVTIGALMVLATGLPINDLLSYALLAIAVTVLAIGRITSQRSLWTVAVLLVVAALTAKILIKTPLIEEGHNVFLPGGESNALVSGLPPDVYRAMAAEFDRASPPATRCKATTPGCWQTFGRPDRVYAFSFDGLYDKPAYSRRVTGIDFSDADLQRLGFVNEVKYNWDSSVSEIDRAHRQRGLRGILHPWRITMPHFVMFRFPAAFVGSQLCWKGSALWETADGQFAPSPHAGMACRPLESNDIGKRIFGLAISSPLAMILRPTLAVRFVQLAKPALELIAVVALLMLLVRWQSRQLLLPLTFITLALVVIVANDSSLLSGLRPFDSGDDGLIYDGWSRLIVQKLLAGDISGALQGLEPVFYFTPGSRYLRAIEHMAFGENYFGYVSLLLLLPFLVFWLFRRFLNGPAALAIALVFVGFPIGVLFGSTFYLYVKHAAHGYGDSAGAIFFIAGTIGLVGCSRRGPKPEFLTTLGTGILIALALFVRPNFAVGAAVALGGAGLAALWQRRFRMLAGLCIGFFPVFGMALHNWYFGGTFILFSLHTTLAQSMPMPPHAYLSALWELVHFDFAGGAAARGVLQIGRMLIGPSESALMVPLHAAALVIVARVLLSARYEGWLRLVAASTLGLYTPDLFFIYSDRYQLVAWLFTLLVCCVWVREEGLVWLRRRYPRLIDKIARQPFVARIRKRFDQFARASGVVSAPA